MYEPEKVDKVNRAHSFSQGVKSDLLRTSPRSIDEIEAELTCALLCAGKASDENGFPQYIRTSSSAYAERLVGQFRELGLDALAEKTVGESWARWTVFPYSIDNNSLFDLLCKNATPEKIDRISSSSALRRAAIRGAFLAAGVMIDPYKAYQVEFSVRNREATDMLTLFLHAEDIEPSRMNRSGREVLYFKEGETIASFLALIGAHNSLLRYESIRVEKELRNSVNRVVNCDTANARRQADASIRQIQRIELLLESEHAAAIPPELYMAACVRVENPGMSIRDIGLLMTPPIGKSGMNHRLRKLEELADDLSL
jgi:DNA-binding transcriptional regulator WhiA